MSTDQEAPAPAAEPAPAPESPADRWVHIAMMIGSLIHDTAGWWLRKRNEDLAGTLHSTVEEGRAAIEAAYHLGRRHEREHQADGPDPGEQEHQADGPAAAELVHLVCNRPGCPTCEPGAACEDAELGIDDHLSSSSDGQASP